MLQLLKLLCSGVCVQQQKILHATTETWCSQINKQLKKLRCSGYQIFGLPLWLSYLRICLQCGRPGFDPWVRKIPWRRERLPTPVFGPGEFHGLYSPWGHKESGITKWLSLTCLLTRVKYYIRFRCTPTWFIVFKDYIILIKYWLYFLCCTIYPCSLFILYIL